MSSPEVVVRLEELLAGAVPDTGAEARLQGLVRELRGASVAAPLSLQERVAGIGAAAQPRLRRPSRRLVAVLAVTILVLAAGAFAVLRFTTESRTASGNPAPAAALATQSNLERKYPPLTTQRFERLVSGLQGGSGTIRNGRP